MQKNEKKYKFEYIKESVDKFADGVPKDEQTILSLPFDVMPPFILYEDRKMVYKPAYDHYGETIEDFDDWIKQRTEYCRWLAKQYKEQGE